MAEIEDDDVNMINIAISSLYPKVPGTTKPLFRVVKCDDNLREYRRGVFDITTPAGIFLRTESGVHYVRKYSYLPDCWVVEKWMDHNHPDVKTDEIGSYEPVYPFLSSENQPLPLKMKIVQMVIQACLTKSARGPGDFLAENQKIEDDEVEYFKEMLGE